MFFTATARTALVGAMLASVAAATAACNPASLNTTSFNYVNDIENQTVHDIAVKFSRGVCDIGRANLSKFSCTDNVLGRETDHIVYSG